MDLFAKLGVDWRLLVFQMINFSIVLAVLHRFLYKPLMAALEKRRGKIEESLAIANDIEKKLQAAESDYEHKIEKAKNEARLICERAVKDADHIKSDVLARAEEGAAEAVKRAESEIREEKERAITEVRGLAAEIGLSVAEKILQEKLDTEKDKGIFKKLFSRQK